MKKLSMSTAIVFGSLSLLANAQVTEAQPEFDVPKMVWISDIEVIEITMLNSTLFKGQVKLLTEELAALSEAEPSLRFKEVKHFEETEVEFDFG